VWRLSEKLDDLLKGQHPVLLEQLEDRPQVTLGGAGALLLPFSDSERATNRPYADDFARRLSRRR
jgi:hypothetical protein